LPAKLQICWINLVEDCNSPNHVNEYFLAIFVGFAIPDSIGTMLAGMNINMKLVGLGNTWISTDFTQKLLEHQGRSTLT
jgi:hypothetical protein